MSNNKLTLRTVNDLIEVMEQFYIPAYQRGYRWSRRQVEDLLNDILEFHLKEKNNTEFYCLQPVVVRREAEKWELIDGQQRITTLFIILSYFNRRMAEEFRRQLFSIDYATRDGSKAYLSNINEDEKGKNIDFFHMYGAYDAVKVWFRGKENLINDIESIFLNKVKVIWYEIRDQIDPVEVFTRLNIGKIPLTNAELVKALFLRAGNFGQDMTRQHLRRLQIAQQWDDMEQALQHDEFWYFLNNKSAYTTRIEFILELVADELDVAKDARQDPYYVFIAFNRWFNGEGVCSDGQGIDDRWERIQKFFLLLHEWYQDRYWFHLIGFLIDQGEQIRNIKLWSESEPSKESFRQRLKKTIFNRLFPNQVIDLGNVDQVKRVINDVLPDWSYGRGQDSGYIRRALLLFNIASILRNSKSNYRFQYDRYKVDSWDLEHIRSVKSDIPTRVDKQKEWLGALLAYFTGNDASVSSSEWIDNVPSRRLQVICKKALDASTSIPFDEDLFKRVYFAALRYFKESDEGETDNSIANLALLDATTNRSYGNAVFPIKRLRIISLDKEGSFVPICTKNAFLKYYSSKVDNMMFWGGSDGNDYQDAIVEMLVWFFCHEGLMP